MPVGKCPLRDNLFLLQRCCKHDKDKLMVGLCYYPTKIVDFVE